MGRLDEYLTKARLATKLLCEQYEYVPSSSELREIMRHPTYLQHVLELMWTLRHSELVSRRDAVLELNELYAIVYYFKRLTEPIN